MNPLLGEQIWWYVARSGGMVALGLTAASVLWGLLLTTKFLSGVPKQKWLLDLHRFLGALSVIFALIHVAAQMFDTFVSFGIVDVLVPFASGWKPGPVAWGIVSFWLLLAVQVTSMLMHRLPRRWWRAVHMLSYVVLWTGIMHGVTAGTEGRSLPFLLAVGGAGGLIIFLTGWRILMPSARRARSFDHASVGSG